MVVCNSRQHCARMADDEALAKQAAAEQEKAVEQFRIKKLIKSLHEARGAGTSMISLVIPPRDQIARVSKMLADEYGTASNIKSRVNRQSVLSAITSTTQRLKLYSKVLFCFTNSIHDIFVACSLPLWACCCLRLRFVQYSHIS